MSELSNIRLCQALIIQYVHESSSISTLLSVPRTRHCLRPDLSPAGSTSCHSPSWCQAMNAEGEGSPTLTIFYCHPALSLLDPISRPRRGGGGRNVISLEKGVLLPSLYSFREKILAATEIYLLVLSIGLR